MLRCVCCSGVDVDDGADVDFGFVADCVDVCGCVDGGGCERLCERLWWLATALAANVVVLDCMTWTSQCFKGSSSCGGVGNGVYGGGGLAVAFVSVVVFVNDV